MDSFLKGEDERERTAPTRGESPARAREATDCEKRYTTACKHTNERSKTADEKVYAYIYTPSTIDSSAKTESERDGEKEGRKKEKGEKQNHRGARKKMRIIRPTRATSFRRTVTRRSVEIVSETITGLVAL